MTPSLFKSSIPSSSSLGGLSSLTALLGLAAGGIATAAPFAPGNVVIYRVGTGTGSLVNTGNPVFLDEYTPAGSLVQSIPMPTTVVGADKRLVASGTATSEGLISRSADGKYLLATGYDAPLPTTGLTGTAASAVNRVVARIDAAGTVNTTTGLSDAPTANNIRGAASSDGTSFWVSGGSNGVRYAGLAATTSTDLTSSPAGLTNTRGLSIFNGQLYVSAGSGTNTFRGVSVVGTGLPTSTGQSVTRLAGLTDTLCPSSYGFFFADLDAGVSGLDTLYLCDDTTTVGGRGGIQKYSLVGGTWTANGVVGAGADAYRGLTAAVSGTSVNLYATRKGGSGATGGGELVSLVDSTGYNATITATPTLLATATGNTAFRGIALAPVIPGPTSVDLSKYVRVGRYDLPEPTRTTPPTDNLLGQEASGVTYNWDTDSLFIVGDGGTSVTEVTKTGTLVSTMTLPPGGSSQGTEFFDTEGITYIGGGQFVMTEERDRQAVKFTYVAGGTLTRAAAQTVKLGTTIGNLGLEGLSYDPQTSGFIFAKEAEPQGLFQTTIDFAAGTASNGSPATVNSTSLFAPALASLEDMSDVFAFSNLPSMDGQPQAGNLLILSQESGMVRQVDRSGNILSTLTLVADSGNPLTIQNQTHEGITMDRDGNIYIVSENGGGDTDHPQLWVYAPSNATNNAPAALALSSPSTTIPDTTSTAAPIKMATLVVTDADGVGVNNLSVSGTDAADFQIIGSGLYLKAGVTLNGTVKSTYNVTVNVDDTTVGNTPDAFVSFTLNVSGTGPATSPLRVTEAAPWSSGDSLLGADWFELTNTGSTAVDITGYRMFDSGASGFGGSGPLNGITSIAPGESVIFVDGSSKVPTFISHWFGSNPPVGLQVGYYSGPGLSTGGDAVTIYTSGGTLQARVDFGAAPSAAPRGTFDNSERLNNVTLTQISMVGANGAFVAAASANDIGSPGMAVVSGSPLVSIGATDAIASEAATNTGTFRISRTGSTAAPMEVIFSIATGAGQAVEADYTPVLASPATIPAGESFVDITIIPADDVEVEGDETVTLTLGDAGSYDVGSPASATVTVQDNDVANQAPTALAFSNTVTVLKDSTNISSPIKVADIVITDDGQGTNDLSLTGADASFFEITGGALYLKAGTPLSYATKASYSVTVNVDDTTVGSTPDATASFTLGIVPGSIVITEVHPTGSSNNSYGGDWFEVTNTGSTAVDVTGWKVDDSSNGEVKIALRGVTSIPAGKSAIFIEGNATGTTDASIKAAFSSAWFGSATPPTGVLIGGYGGSGIGLSSSADAVNLFDSTGNRVTGVSFGASTTGVTFDNAAGLGSISLPLPAVSTASVIGTNGAFRSANNTETGSPGNIVNNSGSFPAWLASNGYTSLGIDLDSDNDGLSDGLEYFFNLNPNDGGDFSNLPQVTANGGMLQLGYTLLKDASGVTGSLEVSGDLQSWTPALSGIDYALANSVVNGDEIALTYNVPGTGPSAPSPSAAYLTPNTSDPAGASLGGVRVVNEGLVGVGRLSGENVDKFGETQGAASGLVITDWAYASGQFSGKFQVLPDRGYGDGTSNYAARLHEVDFTFTPYYGTTATTQGQVQPFYNNVSTKFTYQDGPTLKFTTGLNPDTVAGVVGARTGTLFGQTVGLATAANGQGGSVESLLSFDAEAIYLFPDGSGYVSDEYGTYIARFDATKKITGLTQLPGAAQPNRPVGTPNFDSTNAPANGRRNNQGLEGMSVSPDGTLLFALLQSATVQDTNGGQQQTRNNARLFVYNIVGSNRENPQIVGEYVVKLPQIDLNPNAAPSALDGTAAQSEIVALSNSSFLMLPRDGNGLGKGTTVPITFKSVQLVDFASATNILGQFDNVGQALNMAVVNAAATAEVINMLQQDDLAKFGLNTNTNPSNANTLNEKIEGMALVPDLSTEQTNDFFLFVANDNDFQSSNVKMLDAAGNFRTGPGGAPIDGRLNAGITNDAMYYVWRLTIDSGAKKFFRMDVSENP